MYRLTSEIAVGRTAARTTSVPLPRLVRVEARKMVDSLAGRTLIIIMAGLAGLIVAVAVVLSPDLVVIAEAVTLGTTPAVIFLPVIAVLLVTSEWGHRTGLTTFALTPNRLRVLAAKTLAALIFSAGVVTVPLIVGLLLGATMHAVAGTEIAVGDLASVFATLAAATLCSVVLGIGIGASTLSTPLGVLAVILVPLLVDTTLLLALPNAGPYLVSATFTNWVGSFTAFGPAVITSFLLWFALPMSIGAWRYCRTEVR